VTAVISLAGRRPAGGRRTAASAGVLDAQAIRRHFSSPQAGQLKLIVPTIRFRSLSLVAGAADVTVTTAMADGPST
jgi:hypothetical protein